MEYRKVLLFSHFGGMAQKKQPLLRWAPLDNRFRLQRQFCGGLASAFPGTATVESDFSVLKWDYDEFRTSHTEVSLEGIRQCKQFKKVGAIQRIPGDAE